MTVLIPSLIITHVDSSYIYLFVYGFATFVMHDIISNKMCSMLHKSHKNLYVL